MAAVASSVRLTRAVSSTSCRPARESEAFGLRAELSTLEAAPDEPAPGGILAVEDLTKEAECSGTLSAQELAQAPELAAAGVDPHVEESHVE